MATGDEEVSARERLGLLHGEMVELDKRLEEMGWERMELEAQIRAVETEVAAEGDDVRGPTARKKKVVARGCRSKGKGKG